jgi:type IV pilus assembly protein PilQ
MNGFLRLLLILVFAFSMVRCASTTENEDVPASATDQDFADFDNGTAPSDSPSTDTAASDGGGLSLEDELNQSEGAPPAAAAPEAAPEPVAETPPVAEQPGGDEFAQFENEKTAPVAEQPPPPPVVETPVEPPPVENVPPPVVELPPEPEAEAPQQSLAHIKNIKYKANDNGGSIVIEADQPLNFDTRKNPDTNQFVIEIPNSELPARLKRPFNTKDMQGGIGSLDAYQDKGSTTTRIVVQLRANVSEPTVQAEGNSLLVVQSGESSSPKADIALKDAEGEDNTSAQQEEPAASQILSSRSLDEFLSGNSQFFGKKISLEVSEMDVREVFKLISTESGINLVLSDDVKGTISLKLRQVPWDQAFVVIMKAKKLGYTRAGSVLRVAPYADIKSEEDDSIKMANAKKATVALKVRMLSVSYAKIDDLVKQITPFLSERGKVVGDARTSAIVVSDLDENIDRVSKLVASVDVPPPQVLIEGKIVEAGDQFQRQIGVNWSASGQPGRLGNSSGMKKIIGQSTIQVSPGMGTAAGSLQFHLGVLDVLGNLDASLALFESQNTVKVLSSPRVVTLHNEPAEINQTTEIPLLKQTESGGVVTKSVEYKSVKLRLQVTPQITNDAAVLMAVDVNRDFLGAVVDQNTQARPINTRTAKTKVMVRNGQTAVIGGIYQSDQSQSETKIPYVGDIPILGWLFKNRSNQHDKNELLIFITPRILGQADSQGIPSERTGGTF